MDEKDESFSVALAAVIDQVRVLTGGQLRWKDADFGLRQAQPRQLVVQDHPACLEVKHQLGRLATCVAWCGVPGRTDMGRGTCHAGLVQWRLPVHDAAGLIGHACFGPFARGRADLPQPPPESIVRACQGLVQRAISGLAAARQRELGRMQWKPRHPCLAVLLDQIGRRPRFDEDAATLAARIRISSSRLQHLCRSELGASLRELRDQHLLAVARRRLLDAARLPIRRIASELGFNDQRAFATWFRRQTGCSPSAWRADASA